MRASIAAESAGIPSVSLVCEGFVKQATATGRGHGYDGLPIAVMPGHVDAQSADVMLSNLREVAVDQVITGLTEAVSNGEAETEEPTALDVAASGTIDEINRTFIARGWSDGSPIIPPTRDRVEQFITVTAHDPWRRIGIAPSSGRDVTIWSIAVNAVMAGCEPAHPARTDCSRRDPRQPALRRRTLREHDRRRRADDHRRPLLGRPRLQPRPGRDARRSPSQHHDRSLAAAVSAQRVRVHARRTRQSHVRELGAMSYSPKTWRPSPTSDGSH